MHVIQNVKFVLGLVATDHHEQIRRSFIFKNLKYEETRLCLDVNALKESILIRLIYHVPNALKIVKHALLMINEKNEIISILSPEKMVSHDNERKKLIILMKMTNVDIHVQITV